MGYELYDKIKHEQELELERLRELNEQVRAEKEAERRAKEEELRKKAEEDLETRLAPIKAQKKRQWLIDHPDKRAEDFEGRIWRLVREQILEEEMQALIERKRQQYYGI